MAIVEPTWWGANQSRNRSIHGSICVRWCVNDIDLCNEHLREIVDTDRDGFEWKSMEQSCFMCVRKRLESEIFTSN